MTLYAPEKILTRQTAKGLKGDGLLPFLSDVAAKTHGLEV